MNPLSEQKPPMTAWRILELIAILLGVIFVLLLGCLGLLFILFEWDLNHRPHQMTPQASGSWSPNEPAFAQPRKVMLYTLDPRDQSPEVGRQSSYFADTRVVGAVEISAEEWRTLAAAYQADANENRPEDYVYVKNPVYGIRWQGEAEADYEFKIGPEGREIELRTKAGPDGSLGFEADAPLKVTAILEGMRKKHGLATADYEKPIDVSPGTEALLATLGERLSPQAAQFILYSIEPEATAPGVTDERYFHGYRIRGQVDIQNEIDRAYVAKVTLLGARTNKQPASCFAPHHALRVVDGSGTTDLVICFSCGVIQPYGMNGEKKFATESVGGPIYNEILKRHGVLVAE